MPSNPNESPNLIPLFRFSNLFRLVKLITATATAGLLVMSLSPTPANAGTISTLTVPMTIRPADSTEIAGFESLLKPTILPQNGPNINTNFTETKTSYHTGRLWTAYSNVTLEQCDSNVSVAIAGDHQFTHVANSGPHITPGDDPEAGALIVDGNNTQMIGDAVGGRVDMYVGETVKVVSPEIATSVALVNSGIKVVMFVETRDDVSQNGVQASFRYSGTPQLKIWYDHSGCDVPASTAPPVSYKVNRSGSKNSTIKTTPTSNPETVVEGTTVVNDASENPDGKVVLDASSFSDEKNTLAIKAGTLTLKNKKSDNSPPHIAYLMSILVLAGMGSLIFWYMRREQKNKDEFVEPYNELGS